MAREQPAGWHLWCFRDDGAVDLGSLGSEAAARAAMARANAAHEEKGLRGLHCRFAVHPAGWEPEGHGLVPGLPKSREKDWPAKPVLWWKDDRPLPLFLREGKTERRDARLAPELVAARRAAAASPRAPSPVARPEGSVPPGLAALTAALANPPQKRRA